MRQYYRLLVASLIGIAGCATFGGEPAATVDATPPPDYHPVFIKRTGPFDPNANPPIAQISRVESNDMRKMRIYVHLIDSNGTYLTGAAAAKYKKYWCALSEDLDGNVTEIKNFTLREVTENDRDPNAIALVMDHSGSMGDERARTVQNAAEALIKNKKPEDGIAIVKYDNKVNVEVPFTTNQGTLLSGLQKNGLTGYGNGTAIMDGTLRGIQEVTSAAGFKHKAVLMFSDGRDNSSSVKKDSVLRMAQQNGVFVCAVAFGDNVNQNLLEEMSGSTGGTYNHIYCTCEFGQVFDDVYKRLRNYYVLEYTPIDYGVHTIRLKLCLPKDSVIAIAQYDNTPDIGSIVLLNVFFDYNKSDIKPESKKALDNVTTLLRAFPNMQIEVRGHTDNLNSTKDPDFNTKLSQRRADAVKQAIVKNGIAAERVTSKGFGDSNPIADNGTEDGRAQNRRTEFIVISR